MSSVYSERDYKNLEMIDSTKSKRYVEVVNDSGSPLPIAGEFTSSGLKNGGRILFVTIHDTIWTPLPPTALVNRNALSIQNRSGQDIYLAYEETPTAWLVLPVSGERAYDITDNIIIYGKSTNGSVDITIEELS